MKLIDEILGSKGPRRLTLTAQEAMPALTHPGLAHPHANSSDHDYAERESAFAGQFAWVAIEQLIEDPNNPRHSFEGMDELIASIQAQGILLPLLVTPARPHNSSPATYGVPPIHEIECWQIIDGEQRSRAAQALGLARVPIIKLPPLDDVQRTSISLVCNQQRTAIPLLDQARAFAGLIKGHHLTQRHLADLIGWDEARISKMMAILRIPERLLAKLGTSQVLHSQDSLERIGAVSDPAEQERLFEMSLGIQMVPVMFVT